MPNILENDQVYVSLIGPFLGYYARIPDVKSDIEARLICNGTRGLRHIWFTTYSLKQVEANIARFGGQIIKLRGQEMEGWNEVYEHRAAHKVLHDG